MKWYLLAAASLSVSLASAASGNTTMSINTGYNHANFNLYSLPSGGATVSDQYWIKIASYEPPAASVPVAPAFVINHSSLWLPPMTFPAGNPSRWIGARPTPASAPGVNQSNPGYSIFRKCFCLMPGYQNPRLSFQIRGDDTIQVWINSAQNNLLGPIIGNWGTNPPRAGATNNPAHFRAGRNCLYVLVEDVGTVGGAFNLAGTMSAVGLMPVAGAGVNSSFAPCQCGSGPHGTDTSPASAGAGAERMRAQSIAPDDDRATIEAIVRIAEARRTRRPTR